MSERLGKGVLESRSKKTMPPFYVLFTFMHLIVYRTGNDLELIGNPSLVESVTFFVHNRVQCDSS